MLFALVGLATFLGILLFVAYLTNWTLAIGIAMLVIWLLNKAYDKELSDLDDEL